MPEQQQTVSGCVALRATLANAAVARTQPPRFSGHSLRPASLLQPGSVPQFAWPSEQHIADVLLGWTQT
eukprot:967272-Prymnesium_polylepis.1